MIDPQTITTLSTLGTKGLAVVLANSGYEGASFNNATFLGIARTGNFVYEVEYYDDMVTGQFDVGHVYVSYDHERGAITADY